jgi:hypothetical protein
MASIARPRASFAAVWREDTEDERLVGDNCAATEDEKAVCLSRENPDDEVNEDAWKLAFVVTERVNKEGSESEKEKERERKRKWKWRRV